MTRTLIPVAIASLLLRGIAGCHPASPPQEARESSPVVAADGLTLTSDQVEKLGVVAVPAKAAAYAPETVGYGVVVPHDTVAVAVAELVTAQAALGQSRASAARVQSLVGTAGAMSADAVEAITRQVATDGAALALAERRLSAVIGNGPSAGPAGNPSLLQELANGKIKLLRATFTLGSALSSPPSSLRAAPLDGAAPGSARPVISWTIRSVWSAPADTTLPGHSYFALLRQSGAAEGERLLVWAPDQGPVQHGVIVPGTSLVISGGTYWCYVEPRAGRFVRRQVTTDQPQGDDYFVTQGVAAGDRIVTSGAAFLLAREMNSSAEAD